MEEDKRSWLLVLSTEMGAGVVGTGRRSDTEREMIDKVGVVPVGGVPRMWLNESS